MKRFAALRLSKLPFLFLHLIELASDDGAQLHPSQPGEET